MPSGVYNRATAKPRNCIPTISRILDKINKVKSPYNHIKSPCWIFTGCCSNDGYGKIGEHKSRNCILVHRYTYWYYRKRSEYKTWNQFKIKYKDFEICHNCDLIHKLLITWKINLKELIIYENN